MKDFGKKQIIVIALVVMIGIAGYVNWTYQNQEDSVPTTANYEGDLTDVSEEDYYLYDDYGLEELDDYSVVDEDTEAGLHDSGATQTASLESTESNYFTVARIERQKARSEAVEIFTELLNNENSSVDAKQKAESDMSVAAKNTETEVVLEGLIKAKGFDEAIVYLSEQEARIVVKTKGLIPAQVAQIRDLVLENTNLSTENIKIVEIF